MKSRISLLLAALAGVVAIAATLPRTFPSRDIGVSNSNDTVGLTIQKGGSQTANLVEAYEGSTLKFALPASGVLSATYGGTGAASVSAAKTALGIQSGSVTTASDGTVTNVFGTAFSGTPIVVIQQIGNACTVTNALTVTSSQFIFGAGSGSITAKWIAIGAP